MYIKKLQSRALHFNVLILVGFSSLLSSCAWNNYPKYSQQAPATQSSYLKDTDITSQVKKAIASDSVLDPGKIHVTTNGGVVHLSGQVQTQAEIARTIQLANQTKGVKLVESSLVVVPPLK